ncbi:MAG: DUF993 family protein, partial [Terracoccus sp.]
MTAIDLPLAGGGWETLTLSAPRAWPTTERPAISRVAFGAAHVVADPWGENVPGAPAQVDWDSTLTFRRHLFTHGLGVAEAMDTAQRGMGLDWPTAQELIRRSSAQAIELGARIASGAGTDHLPADAAARPPRAQGAHLLLQDRHRLPRLALRTSARLHHGRRFA